MPRKKMNNWQKILSMLRPRSGLVRWTLVLAGALLAFFILASSVLVYADVLHRGKMFPTTTVLGVDITGMTKQEAVETVTERAVKPLQQPIAVEYGGKQWVIDPNELGLHVDVEALVEQAYNWGWERSLLERMYRRAFNRPAEINIGLEYSIDEEALVQKLSAMAAEIYQEVQNAWLDFNFSNGNLVFHPSQEGRWMDVDATLELVKCALLCENIGERVVQPVVNVTPPSVSSDDVKTVLVVDIMGNTLKWYNKGDLVKTYYVATGQPKYPTPLGKYYIIRKEDNPVWLNPNVEWSKDMPPRIEPGPDNPLGVRALVTSASGGEVLIHGTANLVPGLYSHGCIRMANWAILELYDHVSVGTPLFIWTSSPVPPPPPEEGPPVGPEDPGLGETTEEPPAEEAPPQEAPTE